MTTNETEWPTVVNISTALMDLELGDLDSMEEVRVFAYLIRTGLAWQLQGAYGRSAQRYIESGVLSETGEILISENGEFL